MLEEEQSEYRIPAPAILNRDRNVRGGVMETFRGILCMCVAVLAMCFYLTDKTDEGTTLIIFLLILIFWHVGRL